MAEVVHGRGAWVSRGHSNGSSYYEYLDKMPLDQSTWEQTKSLDDKAVHLAIKALQLVVNTEWGPQLTEAKLNPLVIDGLLGPKTKATFQVIQKFLGVQTDGQFGPKSCAALLRPVLTAAAKKYGVPADILWGQSSLESAFDPGARGYDIQEDSGLAQINLPTNPHVTFEEAFDPYFAYEYAAGRFSAAYRKYAGGTSAVQRWCAIEQHNSPVMADKWYKRGVVPTLATLNLNDSDKKAIDYVSKVEREIVKF